MMFMYTQKNLSEKNKCAGKSSYIKLADLVPKITTKTIHFVGQVAKVPTNI